MVIITVIVLVFAVLINIIVLNYTFRCMVNNNKLNSTIDSLKLENDNLLQEVKALSESNNYYRRKLILAGIIKDNGEEVPAKETTPYSIVDEILKGDITL